MADIEMCQHAECLKSETCWRFKAPVNPQAQSYFEPESVPCGNYWPMDDKKALQIEHVRKIEARGGSCDGLPCGPCPLDCSVVESDDIMLYVAREWLKENADARD